jgi:hypothetical protein
MKENKIIHNTQKASTRLNSANSGQLQKGAMGYPVPTWLPGHRRETGRVHLAHQQNQHPLSTARCVIEPTASNENFVKFPFPE